MNKWPQAHIQAERLAEGWLYTCMADTQGMESFWDSPDLMQAWLSESEISTLAVRRNRDASTAARLCAKSALRQAMLNLDMPEPAAHHEVTVVVDPHGRPELDVPMTTADWLQQQHLGLDLSLAHAADQVITTLVVA